MGSWRIGDARQRVLVAWNTHSRSRSSVDVEQQPVMFNSSPADTGLTDTVRDIKQDECCQLDISGEYNHSGGIKQPG